MTQNKTPASSAGAKPSRERADSEAQAPNDLDARLRALAEREAELERREAALAPREREEVNVTRSRANDTSERLEREDLYAYSPPSQLRVPEDHEYSYRWVAEYIQGNQYARGVQERLHEGYERVMASDLPEDFLVDEVRGDGYARTTGLLLMRIPKAKKEARDRYFQRISQQRLGAVNELQGIAGKNAVSEDRGTRSLTGAEAGQALARMKAS